MSLTCTIKELATPEEMLQQHHLIRQLNPTMTLARYQDLLYQMLQAGYRMVGAFDEENCIGLSGFWIAAKFYSGKYLEVDNFVVDEKYRSAGVGKQLLDWMEALAYTAGCDTVMLDAYVVNHHAHRFYFREGYHIKSYHFFKSLTNHTVIR